MNKRGIALTASVVISRAEIYRMNCAPNYSYRAKKREAPSKSKVITPLEIAGGGLSGRSAAKEEEVEEGVLLSQICQILN
jgi:hypothetical protein